MTKKQRAQVVELLRCAADVAPRCFAPLVIANGGLNDHDDTFVFAAARNAKTIVEIELRDLTAIGWEVASYQHVLLEAAQRVEEGSWP